MIELFSIYQGLILKGNHHILVVGAYFNKCTEAFALRNHETITVAEILIEHVFTYCEILLELNYNKGRNFQSQVFKTVCAIQEITKLKVIPLNPQLYRNFLSSPKVVCQ